MVSLLRLGGDRQQNQLVLVVVVLSTISQSAKTYFPRTKEDSALATYIRFTPADYAD